MLKAFIGLRSIQKVFDAGTEFLEKQIGTPICIRGCGRCCQCNTPMASIIEGINLVSVYQWDKEKIRRLVQTAEGWLLEPHNNKIFKGVPVGLQSGPIMEEWYQTARAQCPFLEPTMDCMIHRDRPLTCRAFGVFRDGMDICPRPHGKGETESRCAVVQPGQVQPLVKEYFDDLKQRQPVWAIRCFVPTVIFRAASPVKFREYIADNKIASAKLLGMDTDTSLMWQPDLDMLRKGYSPDMVIYKKEVIDGISA
jgi:Fe-S-cluster containining protein